ncbi:MAG: insulinase family protein [Gammaproteobacteria bacterium]|nr:insulinase family protein [Gammaproteobacteria bacterium]
MRIILITLCLVLAVPAAAKSVVHEYRLENGMKVIVKEDRRAPIVVSQVWYKVGSSYEPAGITGISHVLEHMMFKGTKAHPPGEFSRIVAANGGSENAFTGRDYTAYFQTVSNDRLEAMLELEADRMRNLTLPEEEFLKEVEVVKEERRLRTEDNPMSLTYEQFSAVAYRSLPYANPIIGWMNDLNNLTVKDLRFWYRRWYAPNNAILVVVGDVDPQSVLAMARRHFGPMQAESLPELKPLREPSQRGEARVKVRAPAKEPYLVFGYKTPNVGSADEDWEPYALEVLASVLDGGSSARFSRNLVRGSEVAVSAGAEYNAFSRLPGMLLVDGTPSPGHDLRQLEQALRGQLEQLKEKPVDGQELDRIKAQVVASKVYELDSVFYQAMQIGLLETIGLDWRLADRYVERIRQVTPEQVRAVARKYINDENLTLAELEPLPLEDRKVSANTQGARNDLR